MKFVAFLAGFLWSVAALAQGNCPSPGCPKPNYDALAVGSPAGGVVPGFVNAANGFMVNGAPFTGGGSPGGPAQAVQFNNTTFAGDPTFTFNPSTKVVGIKAGSVAAAAVSQTTATDQSQISGGSPFLAFATTSGMSIGQIVTGTSIPVGDTVGSIVSAAQISRAATGSFASGQTIIPQTNTSGYAVGQQCIDTTAPSAIGAGNLIATIQLSTSITLVSNTAANSGGSADVIVCDPVVKLSVGSSATISSGANISFAPNNAAFTPAAAFYNQADESVAGNVNAGGAVTTLSSQGFQQNGQTVITAVHSNSVTPFCTNCNTLVGAGNPGAAESPNDFETTAIGWGTLSHQSGAGLSGVSESTAVGWAAGYNITTGSQLAIFGVHALGTCHQCGDVVLMGTDTMRNSDNTDGGNEASNMVCIGINACLNSEEFEDVVIGIGANEGSLSGTGSNNISIGQGTMGGGGNTTDIGNIAMGTFTLHAVTSASRNVTIGFESMLVATTASDNTCIGDQTCTSMTTDGQNVVIGERSGNDLAGSSFNVFVGNATGQNDVSSNFNTYIGWNTGSGTPVTGANNTALGAKAMLNSPESDAVAVGLGALAGSASDTGTGNTAVGYLAMGSGNNTSAAGDTAIGYEALNAITTGGGNTCVGWECMWLATTAAANTVMGQFAGNAMTTDFQDVVIGFRAGNNLATSQDDVLVGDHAGFAMTTARFNTYIGSGAGNSASNTTGGSNIVIGASAGQTNLGTGNNNLLIGTGTGVDVPLANASFAVNIWNVIAGTNGNAGHPNVCTIGQPCIIGILRGAQWQITTDQVIPILPMTSGALGYLPSATKYIVTGAWVDNCSGALSAAVGGVYDAASKGGNALVAAGQTWATCTSATTMQTATISSAGLSVTETAANLYLSLSTPNGTTQTGDIYVEGTVFN